MIKKFMKKIGFDIDLVLEIRRNKNSPLEWSGFPEDLDQFNKELEKVD